MYVKFRCGCVGVGVDVSAKRQEGKESVLQSVDHAADAGNSKEENSLKLIHRHEGNGSCVAGRRYPAPAFQFSICGTHANGSGRVRSLLHMAKDPVVIVICDGTVSGSKVDIVVAAVPGCAIRIAHPHFSFVGHLVRQRRVERDGKEGVGR